MKVFKCIGGGGVFLPAFLLVSLLFSFSSCSGGTNYVGTGGSIDKNPEKIAGSISYATTAVEKATADAAFTNALTKTGDGTVTYTSSDTAVAEVAEKTGEVTIVGAGTATITATVTDSDTYTYAVKTATYTITVTQATPSYIGSKAPSEAKAVGDIVFNDGSATPYSADLTLTDAQKAAAIALIFYKGTGLNSGDDTTTSRTLGVGLDNTGSLEWCTNSASASGISITTILCHSNTSANIVNSNMTFTGDRNGSDNLKQISDFLKANSLTDDTETEAKYPAFYFAKNYKEKKIGSETASRIPAGSEYESGWYMPSLAEIRQIWERKATVDAAIALCGASPFGDKWYWTSSQHPTVANKACTFCFQTGQWGEPPKSNHTDNVCVVRAFN